MREEARRLTLVSLAYAVLTFVMAYPFSASPASQVLADLPDTHLFMWTLGWDVHAFLHRPWLIFDANIYHPYPNTLAYSENLIGSAFLAAPIIWATGDLVLAMNLTALVTCVLCGTGAFFLARRWGLSTPAAFICGLIFAFAPPRFFRLGQLHLTAVQWMPFCLAFVHSYFEHSRRRDLLFALACFSLQALSSGHGAAFLAIAIVLMLAWRVALGQPLAIATWAKDCGALGLYLLAPSIWIMLPYRAAQLEAGLRRGYQADALPGMADFLASPSQLHVWLFTSVFGRNLNNDANAFLFPGFICLALAGLAIVTWRRQALRNDATWFFAILALVSTLMFVSWPIESWRYTYWLPGFNFIRVPSRFMLMVMLCLAVLSAIAFDRVTASRSPRARGVAAALLSLALLGEYSSHPFVGVPYTLNVPAIDRWLATQPGPFAIAEVPVPSIGNLGAYERHHTTAMLHSTVHWQKTVHGYSGIRRPLHEELYEALFAFPDRRSIDSLREVGVTYVVVHSDEYNGDQWRAVERRLAESADLRFVHAEGAGRVYAVVTPAPAR